MNASLFHGPLCRATFGSVLCRNFIAGIVEQGDPVGNETAFARLGAVHLAGEGGLAAPAHAVAHDHDFLHLQHLNGEFQRGRNAVVAGIGLKRRNHRRDIAHDEDLAWIDVEDLGRIDPAIGTGNDHDFGLLPFAQRFPAFPVRSPSAGAKTPVAIYQTAQDCWGLTGHACG